MKNLPLFGHVALALGLAAIAPANGQPVRDSNAVSGVDAVQPTTDAAWSAIKDDTFDQRAHFEEGVGRLSSKLDAQIRALRAKRESMNADTKDWDFAMKEVEDSRVLLKGRISDLKKATTPEVWTDAKDKVGDAWRRSQLAVDKMNSTRTT